VEGPPSYGSRSCNLLHQNSTPVEYAAPVVDGLPLYLANDLERIQRRRLRIIGLPGDALPSLSEKREKPIIRDRNYPCHHVVVAHKHDYSTRINANCATVGNIISRTERHKSYHRLCLGQWSFLT
jgi:hypothetical protein